MALGHHADGDGVLGVVAGLCDVTPKQQRFVEEYLIDLNATQAAKRSGYSKRTAEKIGWENLQKPEIAEAIAEAVQKRSEKLEIDAEWVLREAESLYRDCRKANDRGNAKGTAELIAKLIGLLGNKVQLDHNITYEVVTNVDAPPGSVDED